MLRKSEIAIAEKTRITQEYTAGNISREEAARRAVGLLHSAIFSLPLKESRCNISFRDFIKIPQAVFSVECYLSFIFMSRSFSPILHILTVLRYPVEAKNEAALRRAKSTLRKATLSSCAAAKNSAASR